MPRKREDIKVTIGGNHWTIKFTRENLGLDQWGVCVWDMKLVIVDPTLRGAALVDTVIHEILHARLKDLNEDAVWDAAGVLTQVLIGSGFMKKSYSKIIPNQEKQ